MPISVDPDRLARVLRGMAEACRVLADAIATPTALPAQEDR